MRRHIILSAIAASLLASAPLTFAAMASTPAAPAPPPAGAYTVDKSHTSLILRMNHLGFSNFTARFTSVGVNLKFDPKRIDASSVKVTVDPRSIQSDNAPDGFLVSLAGDQWLDAEKYPQITLVSRKIELQSDGKFRVHGELTLHGVTKPVTLDARYNGGYAGHPYDPKARIGFSAHGTFKRSDFGISVGIPNAQNAFFGVSDEVHVTIETELSGPPLK